MARPVYSSARRSVGSLLFVSGQVPVSDDGGCPEGIEEQTRLVLSRIEAVLTEHGLTLDSIVKVNYYLRDLTDLAGLRAVVGARLPDPKPAATLVEVSGLIDPRFRIEIDAVADAGTP